MELILYNTKTKKKEKFEPINKNEVGFYSCGPTVYNYAHLGNMRTYIFNDILYRTLVSAGYRVKHVINITDVGHLTDDGDQGDDKMEEGAKREGKTVEEIAQYYTDEFKKDWNKLNLHKPQVWCKATEHINEMQKMIGKLERNGFTYQSGGNVYFDTSKFKDYTKFAKLKLENLESSSRVEQDDNKRNFSDFVLWFTLGNSKFGSSHSMKWDSPWGIGYPGWHIECSAMSMKYLGEQFDIHTGGIDHINVHHTNEIAQSEASTNKKPWVKYWLHGNFLVLKDGKMSKSSGDFLRVDLLEKKGYDPLVFRYFCLNTHYRKELSFSWDAIENSKLGFEKLKTKIIEIKKMNNQYNDKNNNQSIEKSKEYENLFFESVFDDLNVPKSLGIMWNLINDKEISDDNKFKTLLKFDEILGLRFNEMKEEILDLPVEVIDLLEKRKKSRMEKNWEESDKYRDEIKELGFLVKDNGLDQLVDKI
ncbi:MAG: cysteine--tRNA ligase [Candidatus Nanoarchaeia archaeon]|nr:cysteine--tRNA ligase [Candidatus Nanoarchaeia archaeon]